MWSVVLDYRMTYSVLLWHKHFCVTTNVVGGFGWPGESLNELNFIYILTVEETLVRSHSTVDNSFNMKVDIRIVHSK